jgi:hypothetical protein
MQQLHHQIAEAVVGEHDAVLELPERGVELSRCGARRGCGGECEGERGSDDRERPDGPDAERVIDLTLPRERVLDV